MKRIVVFCAALATGLTLATVARAQTPAEELDDTWALLCPGAVGDLADRCDEIFAGGGPGSGDRQSEAASGNNLGVTGAQGRVSNQDEGTGASFALGKLSLFVTGSVGTLDRERSSFENGYESDLTGVLIGADYQCTDKFIGGVLINLLNTDTDYDGNAGELDADSTAFTFFGNFTLPKNQSLDAYVGVADLDFDNTRNIDYTLIVNAGLPTEAEVQITSVATSDTEADQTMAGVGWYRDFNRDAWSYGPLARVDWVDTDIDSYQETDTAGLALAYQSQSIKSLQATGGLQAARPFSKSWGVLSSQFRAELVHEFDDDNRSIISSFVGDTNSTPVEIRTEDPDRDFVRVGVALAAVLKKGLVLFGDYQGRFGHSFLDDQVFSVGLRYEFR